MAGQGWQPFGSPGVGDPAEKRLELAEYEAGYGTPMEQEERRRRKRKRKGRKREQRQAEEAAAAALLLEEVPFYQDPRVIGGGLILGAIVGAVWYSKKQ